MDEMLKYSFKYEDEFGQKTSIDKTLTLDGVTECSTHFETMVDVFKQFLKSCGFDDKTVETIQIVEEK